MNPVVEQERGRDEWSVESWLRWNEDSRRLRERVLCCADPREIVLHETAAEIRAVHSQHEHEPRQPEKRDLHPMADNGRGPRHVAIMRVDLRRRQQFVPFYSRVSAASVDEIVQLAWTHRRLCRELEVETAFPEVPIALALTS